MSELKHTPAPWTWFKSGSFYKELDGPENSPVLSVQEYAGSTWIEIENKKNASVIEAAPDLLSAIGGEPFRTIVDRLEALIAFYVDRFGGDFKEIPVIRKQINDIKAAIAKAEGKS